jgi:UDPglucose 6-dehydrogenase
MESSIAVIGLGKIGLPLAACLADAGFTVLGVDRDQEVVQMIQNNLSPYREPGLQELLEGNERLQVATSLMSFEYLPEAIIVIVGTPVDQSGCIDHSLMAQALQEIGGAIQDSPKRHTIIIASTVTPGFCQQAVPEAISSTSGKRPGLDFGVCYIPENVCLGDVVAGFTNPDYIAIGESDQQSGDVAQAIYEQLTVDSDNSNPPIIRDSLVNVELSKLFSNCFLTVKMTFANELANVVERIDDAHIDVISNILGLDSRIGRAFLTGGAPFGGFCFPRDVRQALKMTAATGTRFPLIETVEASNQNSMGRILALITTELLRSKSRRVAILGLAFKPGLPYQAASLGSNIARRLRALEVVTRTYDPLTSDESAVKSAQEAVNGAGIILVANSDPAYRGLRYKKGQLVIDIWRHLDGAAIRDMGARYIALGVGEND